MKNARFFSCLGAKWPECQSLQMKNPHVIPSASISGIDLQRIESDSANAAREIIRIGELLDHGNETEEDFIRLCDLLYAHGEPAKSEELLRCNIAEEGDAYYRAYRRLHDFTADIGFEKCILAFEAQFGVQFKKVMNSRFLRRDYISEPTIITVNTDPDIARFLATPCRVEFRYHPDGCIADIYSIATTFPESDYLLLKFSVDSWSVST